MSYYWMGPWHTMWGGGPGWGLWWFFPLLMLLMIGACVYLMARMGGGHRHGDKGDSSALRILEERFAKGEISREEFEEKKVILGGRP